MAPNGTVGASNVFAAIVSGSSSSLFLSTSTEVIPRSLSTSGSLIVWVVIVWDSMVMVVWNPLPVWSSSWLNKHSSSSMVRQFEQTNWRRTGSSCAWYGMILHRSWSRYCLLPYSYSRIHVCLECMQKGSPLYWIALQWFQS